MKYDDASWHYGGEFPEDSPEELGGTHIGLFLKYCFQRRWAGELPLQEFPEAVQQVLDGRLSGTDYLFEYSDGKLTNEDFSDEGNAFAAWYYDAFYLDDYATLFMDELYTAPESEHDYDALRKKLDERFAEFSKKTQ